MKSLYPKVSLTFLIALLGLWLPACSNNKQSNVNIISDPPVGKVYPTTEDQLNAEKQIDKLLHNTYFARCQESPKKRWFAFYDNAGKRRLIEIINLQWSIRLDAIEPKDIEMNGVKYAGTIVFTSYDGNDKARWTFLSDYDADNNSWSKYENLTFAGNRLPSQISARKVNDSWQFDKGNGSWLEQFPYQKPDIPCSALLNRTSLANYDIDGGVSSLNPTTNSNLSNGNSISANSNVGTESTPEKVPSPTSTPKKQPDAKNLALKFIKDGGASCPSGNYLVQVASSYFHIIKFSADNVSAEASPEIDRSGREVTSILVRITGGSRYEWNEFTPKGNHSVSRPNNRTIDIKINAALINNEWRLPDYLNSGDPFSPNETRFPFSCDEIERLLDK